MNNKKVKVTVETTLDPKDFENEEQFKFVLQQVYYQTTQKLKTYDQFINQTIDYDGAIVSVYEVEE